MSTLNSLIFSTLFVLLIFGGQRSSHAQGRPGFSIQMERINLEKGISYQPIARATIACTALDWGATIDWGDGSPSEMLSHTVASKPGEKSPAGTYDVFGDHAYARAGSYSVIATLSVQCGDDQFSRVVDHEEYSINVFDRVPVKDFVVATTTVNRGAPVNLTITLVAPTPSSGTRIVIESNKPSGVFPDKYLPAFVEIPEKSDHAQFNIPTIQTAAIGPATLSAIGVDGPHAVTISIK